MIDFGSIGAIVGIILGVLGPTTILIYFLDRKQNARYAELSKKVDALDAKLDLTASELRKEIREEREASEANMREEREVRRAEMSEERKASDAKMQALLEKLDASIDTLRDRDDRNASDLRNEMRHYNDRIEKRVDGISDKQVDQTERIARLESRPDAEPHPAGDD